MLRGGHPERRGDRDEQYAGAGGAEYSQLGAHRAHHPLHLFRRGHLLLARNVIRSERFWPVLSLCCKGPRFLRTAVSHVYCQEHIENKSQSMWARLLAISSALGVPAPQRLAALLAALCGCSGAALKALQFFSGGCGGPRPGRARARAASDAARQAVRDVFRAGCQQGALRAAAAIPLSGVWRARKQTAPSGCLRHSAAQAVVVHPGLLAEALAGLCPGQSFWLPDVFGLPALPAALARLQ